LELAGQVAVVTGGANGIGAAIARALVTAGANVATVDVSDGASAPLVKLAAGGQKVQAFKCDVTKSREVDATCAEIAGAMGAPTILVNNVGGSGNVRAVELEETTDELWDQVLSLNIGSILRFCRALVPGMRERRYGRIVNLSSTLYHGMFGAPGTVGARLPYVAAKSAVLGLTRQLAKDLGPHGIAVNAIAPGFTLPDENARITLRFRSLTPEQQRPMVQNIPMGRPGTGEDMANAVLFFVSPRNTYVSGQILDVDGGG
jgi:NAD(P)-dependent dehydrogenase (short-subunit alcohol dehydrogenase family)